MKGISIGAEVKAQEKKVIEKDIGKGKGILIEPEKKMKAFLKPLKDQSNLAQLK